MSNVPETKVDPSLSTPEVPIVPLHSRLDKMRADSTILGSMNKILGEYKRRGEDNGKSTRLAQLLSNDGERWTTEDWR